MYSFDSLMAVSFLSGRSGGAHFPSRSANGRDREEELRFLQELVRQGGPAVYNVYLLRRLRQRAGAVERARVARELHDGAVQSLIAMEMQVDVVRRQAETQSSPIAGELARIQGLLREEVLKLRELMQQMKSLEGGFVEFLCDSWSIRWRDSRERRESARALLAKWSSHTCRRAFAGNWPASFREGLVNVRKHSTATSAWCGFGNGHALDPAAWKTTARAFHSQGR